MKKNLKKAFLLLIAAFLVAQLYQPNRSNPPIDEKQTLFATLDVPPNVRAVLERSCNDCHSHNTQWPWYSYIAPTSWLVARDVSKGRSMMNLSEWGTYKKTRQITKLGQISDQLEEDEMPLHNYRLMHPGAVLSDSEVDLVSNWAETARDRLLGIDSTDAGGH
jgi:hypothetical protein